MGQKFNLDWVSAHATVKGIEEAKKLARLATA